MIIYLSKDSLDLLIGRSIGCLVDGPLLAPPTSLALLLMGVACGSVCVTTSGDVDRMNTAADPTVLVD